MWGKKARTPCSTPIRLTSSTHRQLSSEMLSMPPAAATPALLQTTWTLPNASIVSSAARSTLPGSATSQTTPRTSDPTLCRFLTARCNASLSMSASMTFMPASAKALPRARPMPSAPPVTNADLPASSRMVSPSWLEERGIVERLDHGVDHVGGAVVLAILQEFPHLAQIGADRRLQRRLALDQGARDAEGDGLGAHPGLLDAGFAHGRLLESSRVGCWRRC